MAGRQELVDPSLSAEVPFGTLFRYPTRAKSLVAFTCLILPVLLAGCISTIRQAQEAELAILTASRAESEQVLKELRDGTLPPEHDVHVFLRLDVVNRALEAVAHSSFALPNDPSIQVTLTNIHLATFGAHPTVTIKAKAVKGALTVEIDATAVLIPAENGAPGALSMKVLSFVPKTKWSFLEVTKARFVRALLAVELRKITNKLPAIQLPVEEAITLGSGASTQSVGVQTSDRPSFLTRNVSHPSSQATRKLKIVRIVFLNAGVHVFGVLE